jgi:hypothetical protein
VVVGSACLIGYKLDEKRQGEIRGALDELEARNYAASTEVLGEPGETIAPAR